MTETFADMMRGLDARQLERIHRIVRDVILKEKGECFMDDYLLQIWSDGGVIDFYEIDQLLINVPVDAVSVILFLD